MDTQATVAAAAALHDVAGADRKAIGEMIGEPTHDELLPFGTKQAMSVPGIGSGTVPQRAWIAVNRCGQARKRPSRMAGPFGPPSISAIGTHHPPASRRAPRIPIVQKSKPLS